MRLYFLKDYALRLFKENPNKIYRICDLQAALGIPRAKRNELKKVLNELSAEGAISQLRNHHYTLIKSQKNIIGKIQIAENGYGFVRANASENMTEDIFIPASKINEAMTGDIVEIVVKKSGKGQGRSMEGEVLRIVERRRELIVGRFYRKLSGAFIEPKDLSLKRKIIVPKKIPRGEIKDGVWVVAKITKFTPAPNPLVAEISEVLGEDGDPGLDVMLLIRDYGVNPEFNKDALHEAELIPDKIEDAEIKGRLDLRGKKVFTIDPVHAKDFDDALSVEPLPGGNWQVGVHIADVAYYIKEGGALDASSYERGTSIYPVDRVIPMLPAKLSDNICSLNPHVDRLTMSVIIDMDASANVMKTTFHNSVINSIHRLNYYEVQKIFDKDDETLRKYSDIVEDLLTLKQITQKLREKRIRRGALDLDIPETEIVMDERGVAVDIRPYERLESHKLVEECMLLANELVADYLLKNNIPAIFRIHETADAAKLESLAPALKIFGIQLPVKEQLTTKILQSALMQTQEKENGAIMRRMILRSMKRAKYSSKNKGHFGLASPAYLHFTSPIRRYPDLIVHRVLKENIENRHASEERIAELKTKLPEIAITSSEKEDNADLIERDTTNLKCLEFMRKFIGETFDGFISGINYDFFYVQLVDYPAEGIVYLNSIKWDRFKLDDTKFRLVGKKSGRSFKLGQKMSVQIVKISLIDVEIELRVNNK